MRVPRVPVVLFVAIFALSACRGSNDRATRQTAAENQAANQALMPPKDSTHRRISQLLASDDPVEKRVAQADIAHRGAESLPELEALSGTSDLLLAKSLRETVALMLLNSIDYHRLSEYPGLSRLCKADFDRARKLAKVLDHASAYDSGEHGMMPSNVHPPLSRPRQAIDDMLKLHGWSVPAAIELCAEKEPASRLYGAEILRLLEAWGQSQTLDKLSQDSGKIQIFHGCYTITATVGETLTQWLKQSSTYSIAKDSQAPRHDVYVAEGYMVWLGQFQEGTVLNRVNTKALNTLRTEGRTYDAVSWEDYWKRAVPVLRKLWQAKAPSIGPSLDKD